MPKKASTKSPKTSSRMPKFIPAPPRERSDRGTFVGKVDRWAVNGPDGFWAWHEDVKTKVLTKAGKYEVWQPTDRQRRTIDNLLATDAKGNFKRSTGLLIWPRRHGKSTLMALVVLWLFTSRKNFTVQLQGNTEGHSRKVQLNTLVKIIQHTPELKKLIDPDKDISKYEIAYPKRGNIIQGMTGNNLASAFGDRLNVLWVSDLHACPDLSSFNAMQASMLDSSNTLLLVDSNVDSFDGHVHALQKEADKDPAIYADHLWYLDFAHYEDAAPTWIDRHKAKRLQRTLLEAEFARDILGQRSDAKNALFSSKHIDLCKSAYEIPVIDVQSIAQGRKYVIGAGLDKARSLMGDNGADFTVWTVVLKTASPKTGEAEYYILNQQTVLPNTPENLKRIIIDDNKRYGLTNAGLESYETADLAPWLIKQGIECEVISPTAKVQNVAFPELSTIVRYGRLHFPKDMPKLADEMTTFSYQVMPNGNYQFGHSSQKFHDDTVYSLAWAIYSIRSQILNVYTLGNVQCAARTATRQFCFLLGGNLRLNCADKCPAYGKVVDMWLNYREQMLDDDMSIEDFFKKYVKREGALIYQAV